MSVTDSILTRYSDMVWQWLRGAFINIWKKGDISKVDALFSDKKYVFFASF